MFSANLGSDFKPIKKVASGGDVKDMLSIKAIFIPIQTITQLFLMKLTQGSLDQSHEIANIMAHMSENMQVFTITHLPQVAAKGKQHFLVYKEVRETIR